MKKKKPVFKVGERVWLSHGGDGTVIAYDKEHLNCALYMDDERLNNPWTVVSVKKLVILGQYLSIEEMLTHPCEGLRDYALATLKSESK